MALGRKTGGRKKGSLNLSTVQQEAANAQGEMPLAYMLRVMRDKKANAERRDFMAKAAAPYCHRSLKAVEHSGEGGGPIKHKVTLSFD